MFLRWLLTTFPHEMRAGWSLVRPDFVLWLALASLIAVARLSVPTTASEEAPALPFLVFLLSGLVAAMLPSVLFTAQLEGRQLTWGPVLLLMARKAGPLIVYAMVSLALAVAGEFVMRNAVSLALGDSPIVDPASTIAGVVIFVSIIVRYTYLPFVVILLERDKIPQELWSTRATAGAASGEATAGARGWKDGVLAAFWPLSVSSRLTEGERWSLVFYTLLGQALPVAAAFAPGFFVVPAAIVALMVLNIVQGVFFLRYMRRCERTGVPAPTLPLEAALVA